MVELGRLAVRCLVSIGTFRSDVTLETTAPHFRENTIPVEKGQSLRGSATFNGSIMLAGRKEPFECGDLRLEFPRILVPFSACCSCTLLCLVPMSCGNSSV